MRRLRRTIDRLENFTIMVTGILVFVLSNIAFWTYTQLMIEEVIFSSLFTTFFITCGIGIFVDMAFQSVKRGLRNA